MQTIYRKILFYKVQDTDNILPDLFHQISNLQNNDIYIPYPDNNRKLYVTVVDQSTSIKVKINYYRATDFPTVAKLNTHDNYELRLQDDEGLCNSTHFIYYPESRILVAEYNFNGPKMSALKNYLVDKFHNTALPILSVDFFPIVNTAVLEELRRIPAIKSIQMKVSVSSLDQVGQFDRTLSDALQQASQFGGVEILSLNISAGRNKQSFLGLTSNRLREKFQEMINSGTNPAEVFDLFKVRGKNTDEGIETIDILKDWMFGQVSFAQLGKGREVISSNMFQKLEEVYQLKRHQIQSND